MCENIAMHSGFRNFPCWIMKMIQHGKSLYDSRYDLHACLYDRRYDLHKHFWTLCVIGQACRSVSQFLTCASTANEISTDRPLSSYLFVLIPIVGVCRFAVKAWNIPCWTGNPIQHGKYPQKYFWLDCVPIRRTFGIKRFPTLFRPKYFDTDSLDLRFGLEIFIRIIRPVEMWGNINIISLKSRGSVISAEDSREFVLKTRQCADGPYDSRFDPPRSRFQPRVQ